MLEYYKAGTEEVHLISDNPTNHKFNQKQFEHARRYIRNATHNMNTMNLHRTF